MRRVGDLSEKSGGLLMPVPARLIVPDSLIYPQGAQTIRDVFPLIPEEYEWRARLQWNLFDALEWGEF